MNNYEHVWSLLEGCKLKIHIFGDLLYFCNVESHVPTCSSGTIVPLSGQDPPNDVSGEGSTIGFGLIKLEISQDGGSDITLCMVTFSTTMNWFQGNHSVSYSGRKGDRSKIRTTEIPPMAHEVKAEKERQKVSTKIKFKSLKNRQCECPFFLWG